MARRRGAPNGRRALLVVWAALVTSLVACADGYPSEDSALILSHDMTLDKAIGAMHHLGHQRHLDFHWHYELLPGCVLQAQAKRLLRSREPVRVALQRAATDAETDPTTGDHTVRVVPAQGGQGVVVLDGVDEVDAAQMKWLIQHLPRHCSR